MEKIKKILVIILYVFAFILAVSSILSFFRNAEIRYLKMLDFPRIQFFALSFIVILCLIPTFKKWQWHSYLLFIGLLIGLIINSSFLINYTSLVSVDVPTAKDLTTANTQFSLLLSNVKMTNRKSQPLLELINLKKPDLVLAMEVDKWWDKELKVIENEYPYSQHTINEVTYGMVLYSKFPLEKVEVAYLTNKKVPSFESTITLADGNKISFYSMHPVPPTHFKDLPDNAGQQENALKKLGKKIKGRKLPTIVAGDFNDVVWSYVDDLTGTKNILYDVRVGRGFYNSFNAENFFMRWPLDHVFVTKEFHLKNLERLPKIGSDHFPMYAEFVLINKEKDKH
ncbi:MAG: endonuclease/exonuclease/phosphatase family protein [Bizionia sp.]|nr:endonuclease/exonuclease/phosphatase family protein [Bizionia sp.]